MNILISTIRTSLEDLDAGLKGQLNITEDMEALSGKMFINQQPDLWVKYAYFSLKDLLTWFDDLLTRIAQLEEYQDEMTPPKSLWISGMFNPMSFLTAIMQATARSKGLPLDGMVLKTTVTNERDPANVTEAAEDGAFIHGFTLQGASWENGRGGEQGSLGEMVPKELTPELPVMLVTAIERHQETKTGFYTCPVYITTMRGGTYVFTALLRMESDEFDEKIWILSGVALFMQPE
jgi:dynein heavy chain